MVSKISDYKKRREKMINYLGGTCCNCGINENLQFDHVDHNSKSFDISSRWSTHWQILKIELDKCQLLCKSCHKEKTMKEGSFAKNWTNLPRQVHGTVWSYSKYKCRCNLCKKAKKEEGLRQRAKKPAS
jgi:hypothetical protein